MKLYVEKHDAYAGRWIYDGYKSAWQFLNYDVEKANLRTHVPSEQQYDIMTTDSAINDGNLDVLAKARRVYLFVQPTSFPMPWGRHPNFVSSCAPRNIEILNNMENVYKWTFTKVTDFHKDWKNVKNIPLAYDSINYRPIIDKKYEFDVCYIGGWADNGFDEKRKILQDYLSELKDLNLKYGIFINKGLSHEQENKVLANSKIAINIHDAYQQQLGLDTNERTFKSLGLTGFLISDYVKCMNDLLPEVPLANNATDMKDLVLEFLSKDLSEIKQKNRTYILQNHTYIERAKYLESL